MKLIKFLESNQIPYIRFNLSFKEGKKTLFNPKGWKDWDYQECMKYNLLRQNDKHINVNLKNSGYMVIDIDSDENINNILNNYGNVWKTKSTGRGLPHLWRKKDEKDLNTTKVDTQTKVDLLYQNTFEYYDIEIENTNDKIPIFDKYPTIMKTEKTIKKKKSISTDSGIFETKHEKITEEQNEIMENINDEYISNYSDWLKIIWALYNEFGDIDLINNFMSTKPKYDGIESIKKYLQDDKKKLLTFGTINYYSKLSDKNKYYEIKAKYTPIFFSNSDYDLAELYLNVAGDVVVKQDEELYFFNGKFWIKDEKFNQIKKNMRDTLHKVFKLKRDILNDLKYSEENEKKIKNVSESIKFINTSSKQKSIVEQLFVILDDKNYNFDCNRRELFCFTNKAFNLQTNKFEDLNKYDYITKNCGYEWREPKEEEIKKINKFFQDIQPNIESRESVKSILRRGLYGQQDEYFILFNGDGGNGKGVLMELFKNLCSSNYLYEGSNSVLTEKIKKTGANQELANCNLKRTILFSEPEEGVKLNGSTIKYLSGNPVINARALYSKETTTNIHGTIIMECNQRPQISGRVDNSFFRRLIDILFPTNFVDSEDQIIDETYKLKDESFKSDDFKENHKFALFKILSESKKNIYIPKNIKERSEKYLLNNDEFYNFLNDNYEFTENPKEFIKVSDMFTEYKHQESYINLSKEEKRELNKTKFISIIQTNPKTKKYFFERKKLDGRNCRNILTNYRQKQYKNEFESDSE